MGGCLRSPPVAYGITADTGGHIAYVLAAATAQSRAAVDPSVVIATRLFEDDRLGSVHATEEDVVSRNLCVRRLRTSDRAYREKDLLAAEIPSFTRAFLAWIERSRDRPTVIHAHFADAASIALAAREHFGIPFAYTPHALGWDKASTGRAGEPLAARIALERRALETADAVIVSSADEAERQVAAYGVADVRVRLHVLAPGVPDHGEAPNAIGSLGFADPRRPLVFALARPVRKKNLIALAEAFAASRLRRRANLVILAGQHESGLHGEEERGELAALRTILSDATLAGCVALPPRHGPGDVRRLYRMTADTGGVFVNPALHEPFGLTILEAAAAGCPVVATARGGAADIVRAIGHGRTVDPHDRDAIATACLDIIEDGDLHRRLSEAGLRNSVAFSWDDYARRSLGIYEAVVAGAARATVAA